MRSLLRLDASAREADSHSRRLADHYEARWRTAHSGGEVVTRDLVANPLPHLDPATIAVLYGGGQAAADPAPPGIALSDALIAELKQADDIVVSSPIYNFSMPSALKAWVDHVVRFGHTVAYGERGPVGLLGGKRACFISVRGGNPQRSPDHQLPVMRAVFAYVGIEIVEVVELEGTQSDDGELDARVQAASSAIDALFG